MRKNTLACHQHWVVCKDPFDITSYWAYPMLLNDDAGTFSESYKSVRTTITALVEAGAQLILEVENIHKMSSPHVLFNAKGGSAGVINDNRRMK